MEMLERQLDEGRTPASVCRVMSTGLGWAVRPLPGPRRTPCSRDLRGPPGPHSHCRPQHTGPSGAAPPVSPHEPHPLHSRRALLSSRCVGSFCWKMAHQELRRERPLTGGQKDHVHSPPGSPFGRPPSSREFPAAMNFGNFPT